MMITRMMTLRQLRAAAFGISLAAIAALSSAAASAQTQAAPPAETATAPAGSAAKGKALYGSIGCYQCHSEQGQGGTQGPRLGPRPISFQAFLRYLRIPRGEMPPYKAKVMSDQDVADVYAFLQALPPPPPLSSLPLLLISTAAGQEKHLPRVVLVGDSIRIGYAPFVAKLLDGKAIIVSPKPNGEDSGNVLRNLEEWVLKQKPDVVHINAGLHDLKLKDGTYQVTLAEYEKNLKTILERIQKETTAKVVFATTTPILDNLHAQRKAGFDRFEADVQKYNIAAVSVMKQAGIPINDLHTLVEGSGKQKLLGGDGTHYTQQGYEILAAAVTDSILRSLGQ